MSDKDQQSNTPDIGPRGGRRWPSLLRAVGLLVVAIVAVLAVVYVAQPALQTPEDAELALQQETAELIARGKVDDCSEIDDPMYQTVCRNNIYLNQAQETGDLEKCQKMDGDLIPAKECEAQVLRHLIAGGSDIETCGSASTPELQRTCQQAFYVSAAYRTGSIDACENLRESRMELNCQVKYLLGETERGDRLLDCDALDDAARVDCVAYNKLITEGLVAPCDSLEPSSTLIEQLCLAKTEQI